MRKRLRGMYGTKTHRNYYIKFQKPVQRKHFKRALGSCLNVLFLLFSTFTFYVYESRLCYGSRRNKWAGAVTFLPQGELIFAFVFRPSSMPWNAFACFIHIIAQQRHMGRVQILLLKLCNFCMFQSQRYFMEQANVAFHFTHIILQNFSPLPITSRIGQDLHLWN